MYASVRGSLLHTYTQHTHKMMAHPLDAQIRAMLPPNIANKMPHTNIEPIPEKPMVPTPEYLAQLLKDKNTLPMVPNMFIHVERVLDEGKFFLL